MSEYKTVTKQFFGYTSFKVLDMIMLFFLVVVLTRSFSKEDYGMYSILNITLLFCMGLFSLGMYSFILRSLSGTPNIITNFKKLFNFFVRYLIVIVLIISLAAWFFLNSSAYSHLILPVLFTVGIMGSGLLIQLLMSLLRSLKKVTSAKIVESLFESVWAIPIFLLALGAAFSLDLVFGIRFVYTFIVLIILLIVLRKYTSFSKKIDKSYITKALAFGLPLSTVVISRWIITGSDRYILGYYTNTALVADYSFIYTILGMIGAVAGSIGLTVAPYFISEYNQKRKEKSDLFLNIIFKYTCALLLPALIGFFMLSQSITTTIAGEKYLSAIVIVPFLIIFPLIDGLKDVYSNTLMSRNKTKLIASIYGIGIIINLGLNFIFIPPLGAIGAALATSISYLILYVMFYIPARKHFKLNWSYIRLFRIFLSCAAMTTFLYFMSPQTLIGLIITILGGAGIYALGIFLSKAYVQEEMDLLLSFLSRKKSK